MAAISTSKSAFACAHFTPSSPCHAPQPLVPRRAVIQGKPGPSLGAGGVQHILFEVDAHDPLISGGVAATLTLVGLLACLIPVVRATLIDPLVAMRAE